MNAVLAHPRILILVGDCLARLQALEANSVQCVVTSPPYFGLRDYGTATWIGGDPDCKHQIGNQWADNKAKRANTNGVRPGCDASRCMVCGAEREDSQIGLEATPQEFVAALVAVFREIRRVLRPDGIAWLNLGDSYSNYRPHQGDDNRAHAFGGPRDKSRGLPSDATKGKRANRFEGIKEKDLIGVPWMVAFALRADGWWLRQDVIWSKKNTMPESVDDRYTRSHEYLFLLTKRAHYFYDADAIAEPAKYVGLSGQDGSGFKNPALYDGRHGALQQDVREPRRSRSGNKARKQRKDHGGNPEHPGNQAFGIPWEGDTRNKRSVWEMATQPFDLEMCAACKTIYTRDRYRRLKRRKDDEDRLFVQCSTCHSEDDWLSHFATFPPELAENCIKAGSPPSCCSKCGKPWRRHKVKVRAGRDWRNEPMDQIGLPDERAGEDGNKRGRPAGSLNETAKWQTLHWEPDCKCEAPPALSTILDPFGGAGTTALVADRLGRNAVICELNPLYALLAEFRISHEAGLFGDVRVE